MNDQAQMRQGEVEPGVKELESNAEGAPFTSYAEPDYLARQQALFGNRVLPDSQVILDELRAARF